MNRIFNFTTSYGLYLLAFTLPLYRGLTPPVLALLGLGGLLGLVVDKEKFKRIGLASGLLVAYYAMHAISLLYSDDQGKAGFDLEIKLSFVVIPLLFWLYKGRLVRVKASSYFIIGCLTALGIDLILATYNYWLDGNTGWFFYGKFSQLMHVSYMSMYCALAIALILFDKDLYWKREVKLLAVCLLFGGVFLLASRGGFVTLLAVLGYRMFLFVKNKEYKVKFKLVSVVVILLVGMLAFSWSGHRLSKWVSTDQPKAKKTEVRLAIWEAGGEVIRENWFLGVGCGDVNAVMTTKYEQKGMHRAMTEKLNLHNQFLQTMVATGVIGFILLILFFAHGVWVAYKYKNPLLFSFMIITFVSFLFESMLEVQAGVIFFNFMYVLLITSAKESYEKN